MIKFILAVIAMIFVGLAAYVYMNPKETHTPVAKAVQKTETSIVKKETPSVQKETVSAKAEVVSKKKSSVKNTTVKSPKVVSHETSYEMADTEEIGEGLENNDVPGNQDIYVRESVIKAYLPEIPSENKDSYKMPSSVRENIPSFMLTEEELSDMMSQE